MGFERADGDGGNGLQGAKVLVVEDEAVVAFDLEFALRDFGCAVLPLAASAADALEALRGAERPDVVLLDVLLSDGPSTPVAAELKAAGLPYIVTTGYDEGQIAEPLLRDAPRLPKPYRLDDLRRALIEVLGRPAGR